MIRPAQPSDLGAMLALNQASVPQVGPLDRDSIARLVAGSPWSHVVELDGKVAGLLIGLLHGADYASPNYQWFSRRHERFAYVDRIALAEAARGAGHGPALYRAFEAWSVSRGLRVLCAEVNLEPANPRSLRFHQIFGFEQVGEQVAYGTYRVAMLEKRLGPGPDDPSASGAVRSQG